MFDCLLVCFIMRNCTNTVYECGSCDIFSGEPDWPSFVVGASIMLLTMYIAVSIAVRCARQADDVEPMIEQRAPMIEQNDNINLRRNNNIRLEQSSRTESVETNRLNVNAVVENEEEHKGGHQFVEIEANHVESPRISLARRNVSEASTQTDIVSNTRTYTNIIFNTFGNTNLRFN